MKAQGADFEAAMLQHIPATRLGEPEDIARVVAMLLSEDGRWINGQTYNVDGDSIMK